MKTLKLILATHFIFLFATIMPSAEISLTFVDDIMEHVKHGNMLAVEKYVHAKGNILFKDPTTGKTLLIVAAEYGQKEILRYLLTFTQSIINAQDNDGNTALHLGAVNGYLDIVRLLCVNGADCLKENKLKARPSAMAIASIPILVDEDEDDEIFPDIMIEFKSTDGKIITKKALDEVNSFLVAQENAALKKKNLLNNKK